MPKKVGGFEEIQRSVQGCLFSKNLDLPPPISYNPIQPAARICKKDTEVFIRHLFKLILNIHIHVTRGMK